MTWAELESWTLNQLNHPGTQEVFIYLFIYLLFLILIDWLPLTVLSAVIRNFGWVGFWLWFSWMWNSLKVRNNAHRRCEKSCWNFVLTGKSRGGVSVTNTQAPNSPGAQWESGIVMRQYTKAQWTARCQKEERGQGKVCIQSSTECNIAGRIS